MIQAVVKLLLKRASERERESCAYHLDQERIWKDLGWHQICLISISLLFISMPCFSISVLYHLWDLVFYRYTISYLRSGFLSLCYIISEIWFSIAILHFWSVFLSVYYISPLFYISTLHLRSSFQFMYYIISVWLSVSVLTICPLFLFLCPGPLCMSMMTFHL